MAKTKPITKYSLPTIKLALIMEPAKTKTKEPQSPLTFHEPEDIARFLQPLRYFSEEKFVAILLNCKHEPIAIHEISHGTATSSLVHMREAFKAAILSNAYSVVFAHNHPSNSRLASPDDLVTTEKLRATGELLGIPVVDHVIVGPLMPIYSIRFHHPDIWN